MNNLIKKEVQKRVLQNGKPLALSKFTWCEKTKTFSSCENYLVIDFSGIDGITFDTGYCCTFKTVSDCTFKTGYGCTFSTGSRCTFSTGSDCIFKTGSDCTFNTGSSSTFKTWSDCTFKTGYNCVVVRRDVYQVIELEENIKYQLLPYNKKGYLKEIDGKMYLNGDVTLGEHIIIDNILSRIINHKGNVYKVINHGETKETYIVKDGELYSHGETLKEAKESLIYKLSNRDTSAYKNYVLDTKVERKTYIPMYRAITGACESGTRFFCENVELKDVMTIKELIEVTKGQYGNETFKHFFF